MSKDDKPLDFEQQLKALEDIVSSMEKGDLSLEDSLKAYEKGVQLTRGCQTALDNAQQRIDMLVERDGKLIEEPFENNS
jgi:exodeoxyribonuclease VII small subunit